VDGSEEVSRSFVVSRGDCAELFELTEEIFDEVALLVQVPVEFARGDAIWPRRDDGRFASLRQGFEDPCIGVEGFVSDQSAGRHVRQQRIGAGQIVRLSSRQQKRQRIAECVDQGVDLGAETAPATSDRLILVFF